MNLKEQLISAATTHNEAVAIEKAKNIYDKIIDLLKIRICMYEENIHRLIKKIQ